MCVCLYVIQTSWKALPYHASIRGYVCESGTYGRVKSFATVANLQAYLCKIKHSSDRHTHANTLTHTLTISLLGGWFLFAYVMYLQALSVRFMISSRNYTVIKLCLIPHGWAQRMRDRSDTRSPMCRRQIGQTEGARGGIIV